ncbi:MAG TPA: cell division protein ZapB [Candidatus Deferrimicrobiaceae bacterium]
MSDEAFELIEKRIGDLATLVKSLKTEKEALSAQLEAKNSEIQELARKIAELNQEKTDVKGRVDKLLSRLETIEI